MFRVTAFFGLICAFAALSGCSGKTLKAKPQVAAAPDKVSLMLADAADKASEALVTLAAIEQVRTPVATVAPVADAPPELRRAVTVNWVGPVDAISKMMADRAGYVFQVIGSPPPVPAVVTVDVENKPVIDVLRDIGLQLGLRGDVRVDAVNRVVEIQYGSIDGPGG